MPGTNQLRGEAIAGEYTFDYVAVVTGWFALPHCENVSKANEHRHGRDAEGEEQSRLETDDHYEEQRDADGKAADNPPEQVSLQSPRSPGRVGRGIRVGETQFRFHKTGPAKVVAKIGVNGRPKCTSSTVSNAPAMAATNSQRMSRFSSAD